MGDFEIKLVPVDKGINVHGGIIIGKDSKSLETINERLNAQGMKMTDKEGFGAQITLNKDLLRIENKKVPGWALVVSPEISAGFFNQNGYSKIGEEKGWEVYVTEYNRTWDKQEERWIYSQHSYSQWFNNYDDALRYSIWKNMEDHGYYDNYTEVEASYPYERTRDINHKESLTRPSLRLGTAVELEKKFGEGSGMEGKWRIGAISGVDVLKDGAIYVGGRTSLSWDVSKSFSYGLYAQVDTDLTGPCKGDVRSTVGISIGF